MARSRQLAWTYFHLKQNAGNGYPRIDPSSLGLNPFFSNGAVDFPYASEANVDIRANHATLIRELGAAGTVLLKNVNAALPLKAPKNIAVLGNDAGDLLDGLYFATEPYQTDPLGYGEL
jgi:beta-glucosidase